MPRSDAHFTRNKTVRERLSNLRTSINTLPTTQDVLRAECQRLELPLVVEEVAESSGANVLWVGEKSSENVLFYIHGGCYGLPAMSGHFSFNYETQQKMEMAGKSYALAMLEYTLAPGRRYPTQHIQAIQGVEHLLNSGYKSSNIILAGDSAGGALVLGILSATDKSNVHSEIPFLKIDDPFRGAILISPWTCSETDTVSWTENLEKDLFTLEFHNGFVQDVVPNNGIQRQRGFLEPRQTNPRWWSDVRVESILNLTGSDEVFRDHILQLGEVLAKGRMFVQTLQCADQIHIECILDSLTGLEVGPMSEAIWQWLEKLL